jgi:hypothetical protein
LLDIYHARGLTTVVDLCGSDPPNPLLRPFRFEAAWISHHNFAAFVEKEWQPGEAMIIVVDFLNQFTTSPRNWNHEVFQNIFRRKRHLLARLHGVQKALSTNPNPFLFKLEKELISQYNQTLKQEELLWFQKCRVRWLQCGDSNTTFTPLPRRRRNKVEGLEDVNGNWVTEQDQLKLIATDYFKELYSSDDREARPWSHPSDFPPLLPEDQAAFARGVTDLEIKDALFSLFAYVFLLKTMILWQPITHYSIKLENNDNFWQASTMYPYIKTSNGRTMFSYLSVV